MSDNPAQPLVLIVDDEPVNRIVAGRILAAAGWRVLDAADGAAALALLHRMPALILMDLQMAGMGGAAAVAAIRARGGRIASVPIVAFTTARIADPATLLDQGFDDLLAKPCTPEALRSAAARWRPDGEATALPRLEAVFGADEIQAIASGFRAQLVTGLAALDVGGADAIAHRIAGAAGTLGFAALGRQWRALSEGDTIDLADLRRQTRRTIAGIDRGRANAR